MRKIYDWPFRDRPEVNGAIFVFAILLFALVLWLVLGAGLFL